MSSADCSIGKSSKTGYSYVLSLAKSDKEHLEKFKKDINFNGNINICNRYKKNNTKKLEIYKIYSTATLRITCKKWDEDLKNNFNIIPNKTKIMTPPNFGSDELALAFFMGYIDGDGCICLTKEARDNKYSLIIKFCSSSFNTIKWIKDLIERLFSNKNFAFRKTTRNISVSPNNKYYSYAIVGLKALIIFNYLKDFNVPKMARKWTQPKLLEFLQEQKLKYPQYFQPLIYENSSFSISQNPS